MNDFTRTRFTLIKSVDSIGALNGVIEYYDLTFNFSGVINYSISGKKYTLNDSDVIIIKPGDKRVRYESCGVRTQYCSINLYTDKKIDLPTYVKGGLTFEIKQLLSMLNSCYKSHTRNREKKIGLYINLILSILLDNEEAKAQNSHLKKILDYIYENYANEAISLKEIAEHVHLAPNYCSNLVKKELGTTIFNLIIDERILKAQEYIYDSKMSLEEIARATGFNSYSYFSTTFKKRTGYSPKELKKK